MAWMRRWIVPVLALGVVLGWPIAAHAQTYTLAPPPVLEIRNASGVIVNAGCIRTMLTGTTTDVVTYQTSNGTANANPIIASSDGTFTAFLTPGTVYRFRYEATPCSAATPGATIRTVDGIAAIPVSGLNVDVTATAGVALVLGDVVYLSDGSGALDAGEWYLADADLTYASTTAGVVGMATGTATANGSVSVRTTGRLAGLTGLAVGETYYASATAGALTATPPTNALCVGKADSATSLVLPCDVPNVLVPDSDGTHSLTVRTSSDLTADRMLTLVPGDAARTVTINGNPTLNDWFDQSVKTTDSPQFTAVNVGAATDTTVTRASAGVIAVEGSNVAMASNNLSVFAATTSAQLAGVLNDETGSGVAVFGTAPSFTTSIVTPLVQNATATNSLSLRPSSDFSTYAMTLDSTAAFFPGSDNVLSSGKSGQRFVAVWAVNGTIQTSDLREKTVVGPSLGLSFLQRLRPFAYRWNNSADRIVHYGLGAQDVVRVAPPGTFIQGTEETHYGLNYSELIAPLIQSIQELATRVEALERERGR